MAGDDNRTAMIKWITVILLLASGIKMAGYWASQVLGQYSAFNFQFEDNDSKCQEKDTKEKLEQDQAIFVHNSIAFNNSSRRTRYVIHSYKFVSSQHDEPPCPPPDLIRL